MTTVADLILAARDEHPAFDPHATPDRVATRFIDRYQRSLYLRAVEANPEPFLKTHEVDFPLVDFAEGEAFPEYQRIETPAVAVMNDTDRNEKVYLIASEQREDAYRIHRRMYIQGQTLRFLGAEEVWDDVLRVDVAYVPTCTPLAAETDELTLGADSAMIAAAAHFLAGRAEALNPGSVDLRRFAASLEREEGLYLADLRARRKARTFRILPVQ